MEMKLDILELDQPSIAIIFRTPKGKGRTTPACLPANHGYREVYIFDTGAMDFYGMTKHPEREEYSAFDANLATVLNKLEDSPIDTFLFLVEGAPAKQGHGISEDDLPHHLQFKLNMVLERTNQLKEESATLIKLIQSECDKVESSSRPRNSVVHNRYEAWEAARDMISEDMRLLNSWLMDSTPI